MSFSQFLQKKQLVLDESASFNPVTLALPLCTDIYIAKEQLIEYKALLFCFMCSLFFLFVPNGVVLTFLIGIWEMPVLNLSLVIGCSD